MPRGDRLLVKPAEAQEKVGHVILPDVAQEKPLHGTVIAFGDDVHGINEGDTVCYSRYAGTSMSFEAEAHLILRDADVLGTLKPNG